MTHEELSLECSVAWCMHTYGTLRIQGEMSALALGDAFR